jgi:hypothetical protein
MNATEEHLVDDIERLSHLDANVKRGFIIHLYRLSTPGSPICRRDWSPRSKQIVPKETIIELSKTCSIEILYGLADCTQPSHSEACWISCGSTRAV